MKSSAITFENQWSPFRLVEKAEAIRAISTLEGVGDRLRVVAFAELQARDAFRWGASRFPEASAEWREEWLRFAEVEDRHAQMLLSRMEELGLEVGARGVTDKLTKLCRLAEDPITFLFLLSSAEERGMEAGNIVARQMQPFDAASAAIFAQIAEEEVEHVASAKLALEGQEIAPLRERARYLSSLT